MINIKYLHFIPLEMRDDVYKSLVEDIYYFYFGIKPNNDQTIKCMNGNMYDLDKNNLVLIDI